MYFVIPLIFANVYSICLLDMNLNALKRTENYTLTTISRVSVGLEAGVKRDSLIMNTVLRCLEYSHRNAFMCYLRRLISTLQKMGGR